MYQYNAPRFASPICRCQPHGNETDKRQFLDKASTHEDVINNVLTQSISNRQSLTVLQIQITSLLNAMLVRHSAQTDSFK
jgi:hypothetical protein